MIGSSLLRVVACALGLCLATPAAFAAPARSHQLLSMVSWESNDLGTPTNSLVSVSDSGYFATAQSDFGVNRVFASATGTSGAIGASSVWMDHFTVGGSADSVFTVNISTLLTGTNIGGTGKNGNGGGEFDLVLYNTFQTPENLLAWLDQPDNHGIIHLGLDGAGTYNNLLSASFSVHGGDSFYLAGVLSVGADGDQVMDFAHSAHFGVTVPGQTRLAADSGTRYPNAVPEPATLPLLASAFALLGGLRLRRKP